MNKLYFLILFALHTLSVKAQLIIPGETTSMPILKGQGYNALKGKVAGSCLKLGDFSTQSENETGQIAEFQMLEITSEYQLKKTLNIETSMSLRFGLFGNASGILSFAESVNKHSQSRYLLVHTRVGNQLEIANSYNFTQDTLVTIRKNGFTSVEFAKNCGTHFVYARRTGGEFFAIFEFEMHSDDEHRAFSAAIQASGLSWQAQSSINEMLMRFNQFTIVQLKQYRLGGRGELPEISSLNLYAREFPKLVELVKSAPVTLDMILKDYSGVTPFEDRLDLADLFIDQRIILENIARDLSYLKEYKNTIREIKINPNKYNYDEIKGSITSAEAIISSHYNELYRAAQVCLTSKNPFQCKYPEGIILPSYPNIIKISIPEQIISEALLPQQCYKINPMHDLTCSWLPQQGRYPIFYTATNIPMGYCQCP